MERRHFIKTLVVGAGAIYLLADELMATPKVGESVRLHMIYNNIGTAPPMESAWGLSIWIDLGDESILFDTGGDQEYMLHNLEVAQRDVHDLSAIVISHNHWDHVAGLSAILEKAEYKPAVYVPMSDLATFQDELPRATLVGVDGPKQVAERVWSSGQLAGKTIDIFEQALVIKNDSGLVLLTGCSHPGVVELAERAKQVFPGTAMELVAGGYHMLDCTLPEVEETLSGLHRHGVKYLAPSHCTGEVVTMIFKDEWQEKCIPLNLGEQYLA